MTGNARNRCFRDPPGRARPAAGPFRRPVARNLAPRPPCPHPAPMPGDIARFRAAARKPLPSVTLADLQTFADSLDLDSLAPASRYRILSAVKSLLAFGHRVGYLPFDVGRALRLPAVRSRLAERILPEADVHRILSLEPNERNHALLLLLYASGIRVSEIGGL